MRGNGTIFCAFIGGPKNEKAVEVDTDANVWSICGPGENGFYQKFDYEKQCCAFGRHDREFFFKLVGMPEHEALERYCAFRDR